MQNTDILNLFNQLTDLQKEKIQRELRNSIQFNEMVESTHYAFCPVCGIYKCLNKSTQKCACKNPHIPRKTDSFFDTIIVMKG